MIAYLRSLACHKIKVRWSRGRCVEKLVVEEHQATVRRGRAASLLL